MPKFHEIENSPIHSTLRGSVFGPKWIVWEEDGTMLNYGGRFGRRFGPQTPKERSFRVRGILFHRGKKKDARVPEVRLTPHGWILITHPRKRRPITHAATVAMLDSIATEPDRLAKELEPRAWESLQESHVREVLAAVQIPAPLWDSLCEEFPDLL